MKKLKIKTKKNNNATKYGGVNYNLGNVTLYKI